MNTPYIHPEVAIDMYLNSNGSPSMGGETLSAPDDLRLAGEVPERQSEFAEAAFFEGALLRLLWERPVHCIIISGPFDLGRLYDDFIRHYFEMQTVEGRHGESCMNQIMYWLQEDIVALVTAEKIKVFSPSPDAANQAILRFKEYCVPAEGPQA